MATASAPLIAPVIIGTAGHIDHGKSSIVKRLTGIDPDRLPEEKERGLTIDLGFAPMTLSDGRIVGLIDVPGHERFVKNMVAGATSIDIVMLVVAADDGIMPQTREHLSIMTLLGLRRGLIVINKVDLVEAEMLELVVEDVRAMVRGTFLEKAEVLKVSAHSGQGFDELSALLFRMVGEIPEREDSGAFRMPIQRVFSAKGFGTVMTGVPVSGRAKIGDPLEVLPPGKQGRVRHLNAYKRDVPEVRAGHSSALNLSDVEHSEVRRGMVVATPGVFRSTLFVEARLKYVSELGKPLRNFTPIKLHVGTAEADGRLVLLDKKQLDPGDTALVQFRLEEPVVAADGDRFIVRLQSPMITIGGGTILDVVSGKLRRFREEVEQRLVEKEMALEDRDSAVEFYLKDCGHKLVGPDDVAAAARVPLERIETTLKKLTESDRVVRGPGGKFVHREALESAVDLLARRVGEFHEQNPLRAGMERVQLRRVAGFDDAFLGVALEEGAKKGLLVKEGDRLRLATFQIALSRDDAAAMAEVEGVLRSTKFTTPRREELAERCPKFSKDRIERVLKMLIEQGSVAALKDEVLLHRDTIEEAKELVRREVTAHGPLEAAKFRDVVGTTRKYVIPLLEHLDDIGFTKRQGNARVLREGK